MGEALLGPLLREEPVGVSVETPKDSAVEKQVASPDLCTKGVARTYDGLLMMSRDRNKTPFFGDLCICVQGPA